MLGALGSTAALALLLNPLAQAGSAPCSQPEAVAPLLPLLAVLARTALVAYTLHRGDRTAAGYNLSGLAARLLAVAMLLVGVGRVAIGGDQRTSLREGTLTLRDAAPWRRRAVMQRTALASSDVSTIAAVPESVATAEWSLRARFGAEGLRALGVVSGRIVAAPAPIIPDCGDCLPARIERSRRALAFDFGTQPRYMLGKVARSFIVYEGPREDPTFAIRLCATPTGELYPSSGFSTYGLTLTAPLPFTMTPLLIALLAIAMGLGLDVFFGARRTRRVTLARLAAQSLICDGSMLMLLVLWPLL